MQAERTQAKRPAKPRKDPRKLVKTATPGVYRKGVKGSSYIVIYWIDGVQHKEGAPTYEAACQLKRNRESDGDRGEFQAQSKVTFHEFILEWIERYQGTKRGFRENTRDEYRRLIYAYALAYFKKSLRLTEVTPLHISRFVGWLANEKQQGRRLSDSTIANILNPVRAMFATAVREGVLRHNPTIGLALPNREQPDDETDDEQDEGEVRTLSRTQLKTFLRLVPRRHRLLFRTLAGTGLRISELIGLRWGDLYLGAPKPYLRVRRGIVKGRIEAPKTKYGKRKVPLSASLAEELRDARSNSKFSKSSDYVFASQVGTPLNPDNFRKRVLKPAAEAAGVEWVGYHAFRHTFASLMIARGVNLLQLSRMLGHHSAAFTLEIYAHLLEDEQADALDLDLELDRLTERAKERQAEHDEPVVATETRELELAAA